MYLSYGLIQQYLAKFPKFLEVLYTCKYFLKFDNPNATIMYCVCSKLTWKTPYELRATLWHLCLSNVFSIELEHMDIFCLFFKKFPEIVWMNKLAQFLLRWTRNCCSLKLDPFSLKKFGVISYFVSRRVIRQAKQSFFKKSGIEQCLADGESSY